MKTTINEILAPKSKEDIDIDITLLISSFKNEDEAALKLLQLIRNKRYKLANALIVKGLNLNYSSYNTFPILFYLYDINAIKFVIESGANVNAKCITGSSILMEAIFLEEFEKAKLLLEAGANINTKDTQGKTCLTHACSRKNKDAVKFLIENGADVNIKDDLYSPLMEASIEGNLEIVKLLIEAGADVNAENYYRYTALMEAEEEGHTNIVKYLKENGAKKDIFKKIKIFFDEYVQCKY